jgi:CheY-like chemotaxis protein
MMKDETHVDVVVIEDSQDDSEITEFALRQSSDDVRLKRFRDGVEALNFIFARNNYAGQVVHSELKFVILDIGLPTMDGLEVLRRLRSEKITSKLPIIILTATKDPEILEVAYHLGANSYVVKPNGFDGYVKKIGALATYWYSVNQNVN